MRLTWAALAVTALAAAVPAREAMVNGGFEEGNGPSAARWGVWPPAGQERGVSQVRDDQVRRNGRWSGRLRIERAEFTGICTWHHPHIPVKPGMEVVVRGWARTAGVRGSCGVDVQFRDAANQLVGGAGATGPTGDSDWTALEKRFVVPPGVVALMPVWLLRGPGTVWYDDLSCDVPPELTMPRVTAAPRLDGRLDEPAWQAAPNLTGLVTTTGLPDPAGTVGWLAGDADALYLAMRCPTPDPSALRCTAKQRDSDVWADESIELFLNPRGDRGEYYQFVVNADGVQYDSCGTSRDWSTAWDVAVGREAQAWTIELRLPWASLPIDLDVGRDWAFNLCRNDRATKTSASFSPTFGGFHNPGRFAGLNEVTGRFAPFYAAAVKQRLAVVEAEVAEQRAGLKLDGIEADYARDARAAQAALDADLGRLRAAVANAGSLDDAGWSAVRSTLAGLRERLADCRRRSLRLACHAQAAAQGLREPSFGVAWASALDKVHRTGDSPARVVSEVRLDAARDEAESAQLVVVPLRGELAGVTAVSAPWTGPAGPRPRTELHEVAQISTGAAKYAVSRPGEWPDPLPALTRFDVPAGETRAIWVRVAVPADARPGEYRSAVTVTAASAHAIKVPVRLQVRQVRVPRPGTLRTCFGLNPDSLSHMLRGRADALEHLPVEVYIRWLDFLMERRITATQLGQAYVRTTRRADGSVAYDFRDSDRIVRRFLDRVPARSLVMAGTGSFSWRTERAAMKLVERSYRGPGRRLEFPAVPTWCSAALPCDGVRLAATGAERVSLWVKPVDPAQVGETITVFFNRHPDRWVTTFRIPAADWAEVSLPIGQFHHNRTSVPLARAGLATADTFQFVVSNRRTPLALELDELRVVGPQGAAVIDDGDAATVLRPMLDDVAARVAHWRANGWLSKAVIYGWDEVQPADYDLALAGYRALHQRVPDVPLMQTYYLNPRPAALQGNVGIWCPITSNIDPTYMQQRQAAGEDFWTYVCCGPLPPYGNYFIDLPAAAHRVVAWQTFAAGATGLLYWETNYWHGAFPTQPGAPRYPERPWHGEELATWREFKVNGDGWLLYPGRGDEPVSSVRLEVIADSIEDYELLTLLRARYEAKRAQLAPADRLAIERLLAVPAEVSRNWRDWSADPAPLLRARAALLDGLERVGTE